VASTTNASEREGGGLGDRNNEGLPSPGGSDEDPGDSMSIWDQEPFATIRARPRRFAIGLPVVFIGGALLGALFIRRSMSLALAVQLGIQTLGCFWLYVPALRDRDGPPA